MIKLEILIDVFNKFGEVGEDYDICVINGETILDFWGDIITFETNEIGVILFKKMEFDTCNDRQGFNKDNIFEMEILVQFLKKVKATKIEYIYEENLVKSVITNSEIIGLEDFINALDYLWFTAWVS